MIIIFDLSGVVFINGKPIATDRISKEFNIPKKQVTEMLYGVTSKPYRTGIIEPYEFWSMIKEKYSINDIDKLRKIFFQSYKPIKKTVDYIKNLKRTYKVAYISNGPKDRTEFFNSEYGFKEIFDFGIFSFEAKTWKPNKKIYSKFIDKFKVDPNESIYIDDKPENLPPAKELGMKTIHYTDLDHLKSQLKNI